MTDLYAVVGNPVAHSKSPVIHAEFAKATSEDIEYTKLEAPIDEFESSIREFFSKEHAKGLNVTVLFKEQAWKLCQNLSDRAQLAGAVNTLYQNADKELCGDNTDGFGLVSDLKRHGADILNKRVLIIGAGGAVRGVLQPLLKESPSELVVCNRTVEKAHALRELFSPLASLVGCGFEDVEGAFDIVINGTSASLSGELPPLSNSIFKDSTVAYDMMYSKDETIFNQWAKKSGAKLTIDGLGMLVGQAAESFRIWRGVMPDVESVLRHVRDL